MPPDTPEGAGRYRKKQGRESIKRRNHTVGLDMRQKEQLSGLVVINNIPLPTAALIKLGGNRSGIRRRKEGTKQRGVCQTSNSYVVYSKNLQTTSSLHLLNHLPCNDQNVKKQMSLGKQKNPSHQKPHHVFCLSDTHSFVQRKGCHTNRSRVVRDSVSELWGSKEKGKKIKMCKAHRKTP